MIGTSASSANDTDYVQEHTHLKYLSKKIAHYLHDFHCHWLASFWLPPANGSHKQLHGSDIRQPLRRGSKVMVTKVEALVMTGLRSYSSAALT